MKITLIARAGARVSRRLGGAFTLLLAVAPARADVGAKGFGLRDAVASALRHNPGLAVIDNDVVIAGAAVEAARGADDPLIVADASTLKSHRDLLAGAPLQQPASDEVSAGVGIVKPLTTGGQLGLSLRGDFTRTDYATSLDPAAPPTLSTSGIYTPSLQVTFKHPLLRGRGRDVARADQRRARADVGVAVLNRAAAAATLLRDVTIAYWDAAYAAGELEIRRAASAAARDQLRRVLANIDVGKQPRSASAEVEVAIALREDAALLAEQVLAARQIDLAQLCGLEADAIEPIGATAIEDSAGSTADPAAARVLEQTLDSNPQLRALRAEGDAATIEVEVAENGLLPQLDVALNALSAPAADSARAALNQASGFGTYAFTAGLIFQQSLGRHGALGATAAARGSLRKVRLRETDVATQLTAAARRALAAIGTARRRGQLLARSIESATLDLEAERARFEVGRSTNFDVLRRQDALATTQLSLARARVDLLEAHALVDALTGDIIERSGARLQ